MAAEGLVGSPLPGMEVVSTDRHCTERRELLLPGPVLLPLVSLCPASSPQQQYEISVVPPPALLIVQPQPRGSAVSRGSEGTGQDFAAVAYTVRNNPLLL